MDNKPIIKTNALLNKIFIKRIVFLDNHNNIPPLVEDLSANRDMSVVGWSKKNTFYVAPMYGNKIYANEDSSRMLFNCANLKCIDGLKNLDTSYVTSMNAMFAWCEKLEKLDLTSFDTSNVKDMNSMFFRCKKLRSLNLSSFDISNVVDMKGMFYECSGLKRLKFPYYDWCREY